MPSRIVEVPGTKKLRVRTFVSGGGTSSNFLEEQHEFDLVVLSVGMRVPAGVKELAQRLGIGLNEFGFARTDRLPPLPTSPPGTYVARALHEPKGHPQS